MASKYRKLSYGIDLCEDHAVIVRGMQGRRETRLETLCSQPISAETGSLVSLLANIESEVRRGSANVVGAMSTQSSVARRLKAPFPSVTKARKVLPALLDIQLPFPLETCVSQFLDVRREGSHVTALALASRREAVRSRIEDFRAFGIEPLQLDHEGLSLWKRSVNELPLEPGILRVVARVGYSSTVIAVGRDGVFENAHACQVGLSQIRDANPEKVEHALSDFSSRTERVIRAYLSEPAPRSVQWVWAGVGASDEACIAAMEKVLNFGLETQFLSHKEPEAFQARALAARGLAGETMACNFRTNDLAHPRMRERESAQGLRTALTYMWFGLCICLLNVIWLGVLHYRDVKAQNTLTVLAEGMDPRVTIQYGQEVRAAERAVEQQRVLHEPFVAAFDSSLTSVIDAILRTANNGGMLLNTLTVRQDYVSLYGVSENWSDCDQLIEALERHGYSVDPPDRQDAGADEKVHFSIKGSRG